MSEYIVDVGDADEEYVACFKRKAEMMMGNPVSEEIVRCRDCYFGKKVYWPANSKTPSDWLDCMGPMVETWDYWNDEPQYNPVPPDGFCAWAERREVDA